MIKTVLALSLALTSYSAFAAKVDTATSAGIINMSASMNEMALACKHKTAKEMDAAKQKQKAATVSDMGVPATEYDQLYAAAADSFKKKWATMPAAKQQQTCDQMKAMGNQ